MPREQLGLCLHQLRRLRFQCLGDPRVQSSPGTAQQAAVRHVLHQRMLEAVDRIRRHAALEHQLGTNQAQQRGLQSILGKARNRAQQRIGKLASDRRAGLRHQPHRRRPIQPRQQRRIQARRDRERRQNPVEQVTIRLRSQQSALQHALGQFLDKQRHAIGAVGDLVEHDVRQRLSGNLRNQCDRGRADPAD